MATTTTPAERTMDRREADYFARLDAAEAYAAWIERMAEDFGDEPIADWQVAAADTARHDAPYDHDPSYRTEPEPPTPGAPTVVPFRPRRFDRAAHCQAIAADGGLATYARYGRAHYSGLGKAGRVATVRNHGEGYWRGLRAVKRWRAAPRPSPALDLAVGEYLADAA